MAAATLTTGAATNAIILKYRQIYNTGEDELAKRPQVAVETDAPDFEVLDSRGNRIRLSGFRGIKNIVLVFNRGFG
jgi:hypothetical protein